MKSKNFALIAVVLLAGCGKFGNPLLGASDGQFLRLAEGKPMASGKAPSCMAALYRPDQFIKEYNAREWSQKTYINSVSAKQKKDCLRELVIRASAIPIEGNVVEEIFLDDRVKQRYLNINHK